MTMDWTRPARRRAASIALLALLLVGAACAPPADYPTPLPPEPVSGPMRSVLLVGNSLAGTVSFIDAESFTSLGSVNAVPDLAQRLAEINGNPVTAIAYEVTKGQQALHRFEPAGGTRYIDVVFTSPDGTTLYVSRSNLSDVVAIDLTRATHPIKWRHIVNGFHADHASISPDGTRIVVSVTTANAAEVLDAATGTVVGTFPTGAYPHQNDYSADGAHIYNGSIGNVGLPYSLNAAKGDRQLRVIDADTLQVLRTYTFAYGVRPTVITPDEHLAYIQLSYLNGVVKYDLDAGQIIATSDQPLSPFAVANYPSRDVYPHDSAHHGLALSGDGTKLCDVGTIDNTVSMVSTGDMSVSSTVDVGLMPYWATTSPDGSHCFVTISGGDRIAVLDYDTGEEVSSVPTGRFPQRNRLATVPESELALLTPSPG
jgi:DNA-binding beta-propeller fold protein YncE